MDILNCKNTNNLSGNYFGSCGDRGEGASFFAKKPRVFLCLGSDKLVFDCLGPLVGSMLSKTDGFMGYVYGTMECPVTARQVETAIAFIRRFHFGAEVIVVDSAVGRAEEIGKIKCFDHGLRPALGIDKEMRVVGDSCIMGIVTTKDRVRNLSTCNVKLGFVMQMARSVCDMIVSGCSDSLAPLAAEN